MTDYEIYVFLLCLIVFLMLTALSVVCLCIITKLSVRLIRCGEEDTAILEEHEREQNKKQNRWIKVADWAVSIALCLVFTAMFVGSLLIRCTETRCTNILPTLPQAFPLPASYTTLPSSVPERYYQ